MVQQRILVTPLVGNESNRVQNHETIGNLEEFLVSLDLYLSPQLPSSPTKAERKSSLRIVAPKYTLRVDTANWILQSIYSQYFEGDNRIENQTILQNSVHKERLKDIIVGCIIAFLQYISSESRKVTHDMDDHLASDALDNHCTSDDMNSKNAIIHPTKISSSSLSLSTLYFSLLETVLNLIISIVNKHVENEKWLGSDKDLVLLSIALIKVNPKNPSILSKCVRYLDNISSVSCNLIAIEAGGLQEVMKICVALTENVDDVISSSLIAINRFFKAGVDTAFMQYLDRIYSLHILSTTIHILQSPLANDDISVAETALTLLATIVEYFGPHAIHSHFEKAHTSSLLLTGSEDLHNIISDLLEMNIEETLVQLISLYLPYSVAVVSAAIHVFACLAPYYEDHPGLLHSSYFHESQGLQLLLTDWIGRHRVDEASVAADYLTIIYHWTNNIQRSTDALYQLHVQQTSLPSQRAANGTTNPNSNDNSRQITRKNSLLIKNTVDNNGEKDDAAVMVSSALIAQYTQHTAGKGSVLVPSIRSSFIALPQVSSYQAHDKILIEKQRRLDVDGKLTKREYEPFSLLVYHHLLVPVSLSNHAVTESKMEKPQAAEQEQTGIDENATLMGLLLKTVLHLCHNFQRQSRSVAEYALRIIFRLGNKSAMAWTQILQAGGVGQIIQCIKAHGRYASSAESAQFHTMQVDRMVSGKDILFVEVASTVLSRTISMVDIARYARYLIVDLQIMEIIAQYILSFYAFISNKVLERTSNVWMTLSEFRTASLASQRVDVSACDSSISLLHYYLYKYDLQANPFVLTESDELIETRDTLRQCLLWIDRIVSFEKNRPKYVELNLAALLQQILRHHYPPTTNNNSGSKDNNDKFKNEFKVIMVTDSENNDDNLDEKAALQRQQEQQDWLVVVTLQIIRGFCLGSHSGNILGGTGNSSEIMTIEEQAMRQMMKNGLIPVLLQILTSAITRRYVRDIVLLAMTVLSIFASKHKLQLGASGSCEVLQRLLEYEVAQGLQRGIDRRGVVDDEFSESISHICTAIYNLAAKCPENRTEFDQLHTAQLLQQLARTPYCNALCKHELKDAINVLRF